jgi:hypothetical protein
VDKFNSLSLFGFSGKRLAEVITGGEFVLDFDSMLLDFPHEKRNPIVEQIKTQRTN